MLQKRYEGFLNSSVLWKNKPLFDLQPFIISTPSARINHTIDHTLRLGKYVERLVSFELNVNEAFHVLAENIQIQWQKTTLGELDCLVLKNNRPIHLEIVYKFYLYDQNVGHSEIDHFIGPNRKDALIDKLTKLKTKQLPLLHSEACRPYLENLDLRAEDISQQIYFKAQLFIPYRNQNLNLEQLNQDCITGFYINQNELEQFKTSKFYIPNKKDWLVLPYSQVSWIPFVDFKIQATQFIKEHYSPMIWIKLKNGELKKCFLVWW